MNAKLQNLGSDLARVDAHVIQPDEYEELPELTDADLARAAWEIAGKMVSPAEGKNEPNLIDLQVRSLWRAP